MHVVFIKDYDIYKAGEAHIVERTLGVRFCEMKVAIPYTEHLAEKKMIEEADALPEVAADPEEEPETEEDELPEETEPETAPEELKEEAEAKEETADSKPAKGRIKSTTKSKSRK